MLQKFTPRAQKVMNLAQQHAARYGSQFLEPQHILLGIVDDGSGIPAKVFRRRKIGLKTIIDEIEKLDPAAPSTTIHAVGNLPFSERTQRVVDLSNVIAEEIGQKMISSEHLLLGMLKKPDGVAHQVLTKLGFKYNDLLGDVLRPDLPEEKPVPPPRPAPVAPPAPPPAPIGQAIPVVAPIAVPTVAAAAPPPPPPPAPKAVPAPVPVPAESALAPLVDSLPAPEPLIVIPEIPKVSVPEGFDPIEWFTSVLATCSAAEEIAKMTKEKLLPAMEAMKKFTKK